MESLQWRRRPEIADFCPLSWSNLSWINRNNLGDRFYPVRVPGRVVLSLSLSLWGWQTAAQYWIKILHLWVQTVYPALRLGSGGRFLEHLPDSSSVLDLFQSAILDAAFLLTIGSFLLTVELFYLQLTILAFLLTVGAFLLTVLASLLTVRAFLLTVGKCV